ncbi:hypothetical protein WDX82_005124 [Salmonella enterica]
MAIDSSLDNIDTMFDKLFGIIPWMMLFFFAVIVVTRVFGPLLDEFFTERMAARKNSRNLAVQLEHRRALIAGEVTLRSDFDDWLEAETLSLQIESAVRPHDNSVATALAAVEAAKAENSARIVVLHEAKDTGLPSDEATANAVKDVRERWKALEEQTAAAKTRAA